MQYVRSLGGSVSKTWNSINPATLSGAIDVIVVEQDDGSLACSPFHVRFGKFSLLRPFEKKVEFRVNDEKQDYSMKLGEGGEAFFVFETTEDVPESLQTSPVVSPTNSPPPNSATDTTSPVSSLQEPEFLDLNSELDKGHAFPVTPSDPNSVIRQGRSKTNDFAALTPPYMTIDEDDVNRIKPTLSTSQLAHHIRRSASEEALQNILSPDDFVFGKQESSLRNASSNSYSIGTTPTVTTNTQITSEAPRISMNDALTRARSLSAKLQESNITSLVTETGDLMLDMTAFRSKDEDSFRAEMIARKILADELEGHYDIGALIGVDERGNLWIYSSEEAKESAFFKARLKKQKDDSFLDESSSDPGHQSDEDADALKGTDMNRLPPLPQDPSTGLTTPLETPPTKTLKASDYSKNYAKTLRLTSEQLKALHLRPGANSISFSVNRATCHAHMFYWKDDVPIVISDIDGTITKSDALGHVLNMIGRDWTHLGVAKLFTDIVANGYHLLYLTSRSVGQADSTRSYLNGVSQDGFRLPRGPVIMSPDRTMAALRREIYLRKPEIFKMACLRDIRNQYSLQRAPFYAGFGNRLTDALSYRSVNVPSTRIFTINSEAEVSLEFLSPNKYKSSYVTMREVVDHFFPPVGLLVTGGGEDFTDFNYWRDSPLELDDLSESNSEYSERQFSEKESLRSEDEGSEGFDYSQVDELGESYISYDSKAESLLISDIHEGEPKYQQGIETSKINHTNSVACNAEYTRSDQALKSDSSDIESQRRSGGDDL